MLPPDLQGRIRINKHQHLLGLQISHLTHMDSGIYKRECWQNQTLASQHTHQLFVCNEEVEAEEIIVKKDGGVSELLCNSTFTGQEGTSVRWYHELYPHYKLRLFLDSSVSLDTLVKELKGVVKVRDNGALLLLNNSMLRNNHQFYCLVMKGKDCLSFQNMYLQDHEGRDIFASHGDSVKLNCPSDGTDQQWQTPLGNINGTSAKNNQMYISFGDRSEDFSLVIPAVSEELTGDYSCTSSSLEVPYYLVLCPKKESQEKGFSEGSSVLLHCDVGKDDFQTVQWHRRQPSGDDELITDSSDETIPIPEDLKGRLTLSEDDSTLTISNLRVKDEGVYWCIVSGAALFLGEDDDYNEDYDEEDGFSDDRCIFKQETIMSLTTKTKRIKDLNHGTFTPVMPKDETSPTTNVITYAVVAGVVVLLVVGVIVLREGCRARGGGRMECSWKTVLLLVCASLGVQYTAIRTLRDSLSGPCQGAYRCQSRHHRDSRWRALCEDSWMSVESPRKHILLFATTRSGSSFTGQLLNQHRGIFYVFEPLYHVQQAFTNSSSRLRRTLDRRALLGAYRDLLLNLYTCDLHFMENYIRPEPQDHVTNSFFRRSSSHALCSAPVCLEGGDAASSDPPDESWCPKKCGALNLTLASMSCLSRGHVAIKTVRVPEVGDLRTLTEDPRLDLKIIHLVRDPRAILASRMMAFSDQFRAWKIWNATGRQPRYVDLTQITSTCKDMAASAETGLQRPAWLAAGTLPAGAVRGPGVQPEG
ncbi:hypothetical protein L3Q82_007333 [Scortum barcoo]|uniref:Uncharacterized protein n=1 Tax=Scortum barcoo TaxID=214431 RepID=A0ACB8WRY9_9TELE|nr:hypothetical protein L3Q82_007333 [Scortum barcoo]